jgi:hypothetical protein
MPWKDIRFDRFSKVESVSTPLDPLGDVLNWLTYLTAHDFVTRQLCTIHSVPLNEAKKRATKIVPHAKDARALIHQGLDSPEEVAFLPLYYAILNLTKILILVGPRHAELSSHRWHGVAYDVASKDSQSLLTEFVTLKRGGAIALLYETLLGKAWQSDRRIQMKDVYPFMTDVSHEYRLASDRTSELATLQFEDLSQPRKRIRLRVKILPYDDAKALSPRAIPGMHGFRPTSERNVFESRISIPVGKKWQEVFDGFFDRRFAYYSSGNRTLMPLRCSGFEFTEEFPIILAFFHMSSVVRYKPEFLYQLQESRWWPVVTTARRQCLYKFLLLFWSQFQRSSARVNG